MGVSKGYGTGATRVEVSKDLDLDDQAGRDCWPLSGLQGSARARCCISSACSIGRMRGISSSTDETIGELDGEERARIRNRMIGFVFQHHHLLDELDALDNVALPLRIGGAGRHGSTSAGRRAARRGGARVTAHTTSRTSFRVVSSSGSPWLRALAMKPRLLLADEPTGNLDRANSEQVFDLVRELHLMAGLTSIIVTHDEDMARMCDRVFRLAPAGENFDHVRKI